MSLLILPPVSFSVPVITCTSTGPVESRVATSLSTQIRSSMLCPSIGPI
uniref:Uncharacterized protein n=1 Tax=Arundo donax TaxID=35708 RepID=A0A0A9E0E1_ARUDO